MKSNRSMRSMRQSMQTGLLASCLIASTAGAVGLPVYDGVHTIQNVLTQLHNGALNTAEFGRQAARWAAQNRVNLAQMQQIARQLIGVSHFANLRSGEMPVFRQRAIEQDVEEKCGQVRIGGSVLQGFMAPLGANAGSPGRQAELCRLRVVAENMRFNNALALLSRLRERSAQLQRMEQARASVGNSAGQLQANDNDVARFMAATSNDMNEWDANNQAFGMYIAGIDGQLQQAATAQLRGADGIGAVLLKSAALKAALSSAARR